MERESHVPGTGKFKMADENPNADNTMRDEFLKEYTSTDSFKEWFSGSKLVDKEGNPLLLFHGDGKSDFEEDHDFRKFDTWFTTSKRQAAQFGNVTACYVRAEKVLKVDAGGNSWCNIPIENVHGIEVEAPDEEYPDDTTTDEIAHRAIEAGYDAVWISNVDDDWIADQIFVKGPLDIRVPTA